MARGVSLEAERPGKRVIKMIQVREDEVRI